MEKNKCAINIASLVLGIISIIFAAFWYIALPTGILAIAFGVKSIKRIGSKLRKSGNDYWYYRAIFIYVYICEFIFYIDFTKYVKETKGDEALCSLLYKKG